MLERGGARDHAVLAAGDASAPGDRGLVVDREAFHEKVEVYNAYQVFKYENVIRLYVGTYPTFGSFEVFRLKYLLDFNNYYNLVVWPYMADKLTDVAWLRDELKISGRILQAISTTAGHLTQLGDALRARGEYFAHNQGRDGALVQPDEDEPHADGQQSDPGDVDRHVTSLGPAE